VPIYDYVCGSCGHRFEVLRGINEAGPRRCPECGGPVARAFAPPTIHFKGSGWAKSDRRATSARASKSDAATPASGSTESSTGDGSRSPADSPGSSAVTDAAPSPKSEAAEKSTPADTNP
jgi:putative FmdB family regulatory protein